MEGIKLEAINEETPPERLRELAQINPTVASLVAANPNADAELLMELAGREESLIRKNVAANSNTPTKLLWWLGEEFPTEVLENPVFPLLLLEHPNLLEEIPLITMIRFLQCPTVPISFMQWAAKREWEFQLRLCLTGNSQTPRTILEELVLIKEKEVASAAELHVNYAGELQENWQVEFRSQMVRDIILLVEGYNGNYLADRYFLRILAGIGLVSEFFLELLAKCEGSDIRGLVASIDRLPLKLLEELGQDNDPRVRAEVARNSIAPTELLDRLAEDKTGEVRSSVASNPNSSPKILEQLTKDEQKEVREKVAKNPNAPAHLLKELAGDERVFLAVASNPNTPKVVLENLARYKLERHRELKMILAANANTPVDILEKLRWDKEQVVGDRIAGNPSTPKYLLERFASSKRDGTREALASNPQIPKDAMHLLARDKSSRVRRVLAANPRALLAVLLRLSRDKRPEVRRAVAANPKASFSVLEKGISDLLEYRNGDVQPLLLRYLKEKPEGLPVLLELITKEDVNLSRTIALMHPQMPSKVLKENARSLVWLERCAIASLSQHSHRNSQIISRRRQSYR